MTIRQKSGIRSIMQGLSLLLVLLCPTGLQLHAQIEELTNAPNDIYWSVSHPVPGVVYLSGDEGLYKSTDNGDSWSRIFSYDSTQSFRFYGVRFWDEMHGIASCTPLKNTLWSEVATAQYGLYLTVDGGVSWTCVDTAHKFSCIQYVSLDTLFAQSSGNLYKSIDGGLTWNGALVGRSISDFSAVNGQLVYAIRGDALKGNPCVFKTSDGGTSWTQVYPYSKDGHRPPPPEKKINSCYFYADGKGYAYGHYEIYTQNDFETSNTYSTDFYNYSYPTDILNKCLRSGFQVGASWCMASPGAGRISVSRDYGRNSFMVEGSYPYICDMVACEADTLFFIMNTNVLYRYAGSSFTGVVVADHEKPNLQVYPQPATDRFQIKSVSPFERVEVYDMLGRIIFCENYAEQTETSISTVLWKKGMYLLRLFSKDNVISEIIIKE